MDSNIINRDRSSMVVAEVVVVEVDATEVMEYISSRVIMYNPFWKLNLHIILKVLLRL